MLRRATLTFEPSGYAHMNKLILAAAFLAATAAPSAAAVVTVANVGSILNQSVALPAEATPGSGIPFSQFFEFSLPTREIVTASISDSGILNEKIISGVLSLNDQTGTSGPPLNIPTGSLIDSSPFTNTLGGQEATAGPDILNAGNYFAEVSGSSGSSPIKLAIDGTITSSAVPEPSTWAMIVIGFGFIAWGASTRKRARQFAV